MIFLCIHMQQINSYPFINPQTFSVLKKNTGGNKSLLTELYQSFIDDSNELIAEIENAILQKQFDEYYSAVHTLKGLSGTIGCTRMFEVLKLMDTLNKNDNFSDSIAHLPQLKTVFSDTTQVIKQDVFND